MAWRSSERTSQHKKDAAYELLPRVPEDVHLRPAVGLGPAGQRAEGLDPDDARRREHRDAAVLELRFSQPVEVDAEVVDLGQPERVEAHVAGHGPVQVLRLLEERHRQRVRVRRDGLCDYHERVCVRRLLSRVSCMLCASGRGGAVQPFRTAGGARGRRTAAAPIGL